MAMDRSKPVFRNKTASVTGGIFFLFATGIFIGQAFNPGKGGLGLTIFAAITAAGAAALTIRTLVAPTISLAHNGVRIRTLLRTRSYGWTEIDRFHVILRPVGVFHRTVLAITLMSGETRAFTELNSRPRRGCVDDAAATLNQHLAALRTVPGN
jgi:hypothetical protein